MTVDTKTQEALTTATTDAVSGSIQGIFLFLMPLCTKYHYLCVHTVKSAKCESESTTTSGNSELAGALQAKQGIHSHTSSYNLIRIKY